MTDTVTEDLADQQDGHIPARVPGTEYLRDDGAGRLRPLRPPGKASRSETALDAMLALIARSGRLSQLPAAARQA
jgi:hypothetical protein